MRHVDSAPHWRQTYDQSFIKRLVGGGIQGVRDGWRVLLSILVFHPRIIHLTSSAGLATARDLAITSLARLFGVRAIYHIHMGRLPELAISRNWEWRMLAMAMRLASNVVVLDHASEQALQPMMPSGKLHLVPNGINLRRQNELRVEREPRQTDEIALRTPAESQSANGLKTLLFLGWVVPTKGCGELLEAWRQLSPTGWELRIVGLVSPTYQQELNAIIGEGRGIRFLGALSFEDAAAQMLDADVFVLPTHTEGFPYVILEAMTAGKPIVTTKVGAIPEMLDTGSATPCGLVVEPRDIPALADALRRVMADEQMRADLGRMAREKVQRCYDTDVVFEQLVAVWRNSLSKGPSQSPGQEIPACRS